MSRFTEPSVIINGQPLTVAQSMTLRMAIWVFQIQLNDKKFVKDMGETGSLYQAYQARLREIAAIMRGSQA